MREHRVDVTETVRRQRLDSIDHALGSAVAVRVDDLGGGSVARPLVAGQRLRHAAGARVGERVGERPRIEDRLAGAVGADRVHRVGRIAQQGHPAVTPAIDRIPVKRRLPHREVLDCMLELNRWHELPNLSLHAG